jgi:hypothetical protein
MTNAHLRFGWLTFYKRTEKTTTHFKVRLDRFVGEILPDQPRRAKAHLISVVGGDTQMAAISAAMATGETFEIEGSGIATVSVSLERNAQIGRGSLQLPGQKGALRHLVGLSEDMVSNNGSQGRVILVDSTPTFVWSALAQIHGLPGLPDWSEWVCAQLVAKRTLVPLLGIGCKPSIVKASKKRLLAWIGYGIKKGRLAFPQESGRIDWPTITLETIFQMKSDPQIAEQEGPEHRAE